MSHYVNAFLSTEITCIPKFMDKYFGRYYNNTAGNALTWVFVFWGILHVFFEMYLDVLLKKMHFKSYQRKRLTKAVWYCGFYGSSFLYCLGTIARNNLNIFEYRKNLPIDGGPIPPHIVLGLGLCGTFFFHSCVWELIKYGMDFSCLSYFILSFLPLFTYFSRRVELYLSLLAMISLTQCSYNMLRCGTASNNYNFSFMKTSLYAVLTLFSITHLLFVPTFFIVPLIYNIIKTGISFPTIMLLLVTLTWWIVEGLGNPLYRFLYHWVYHLASTPKTICPGSVIECTLFSPRDDDAFNLSIIRKEIKEREEKMVAKRKPKNRGVLIQTLKSSILGMVAIKRKLNKKRQSESESSESESEKAEKESGSDEESSSEDQSENEDDAKREAREYKEETARALLEDREIASGQGDQIRNDAEEEEDRKELVDDDKKND